MKKLFFLGLFCSSSLLAAAQQPLGVSPEENLRKLGLELPAFSTPKANFSKYVQTGNLIFLSGHGSCGTETKVDKGKLGKDLTIEEGYLAAQRVGLCALASLNHALNGDLSRVRRVVKVLGMVNSTPDFYDQPKVMNGYSDLMTNVFGEKGKHARSAVGFVSLPSNISVEVEMIVEVEPPKKSKKK